MKLRNILALLIILTSSTAFADNHDTFENLDQYPDPFTKEIQRLNEIETPVVDSVGDNTGILNELFGITSSQEQSYDLTDLNKLMLDQFEIVGILMSSSPELDLQYIAKRDENINSIAERFGVKVSSILKANTNLSNELKEGDVINIFSPSSITKIYEDNYEDSTDFNSDLSTTIYHTIIDNENLLSIAKEYGVTVYDIVNANPKLKTTPIKIDQVIKIPYFDEVEENNLIGFLTDSQFNEISYGSFWINLGVSKSNNNADELASYLRREFDDLLLGKTIRKRVFPSSNNIYIDAGPYISKDMANATVAIFLSRLQEARTIKQIDTNFRPDLSFSNFVPNSKAFKANRGKNLALIKSKQSGSIFKVYEGDIIGSMQAMVLKIMNDRLILNVQGSEANLHYKKNKTLLNGDINIDDNQNDENS